MNAVCCREPGNVAGETFHKRGTDSNRREMVEATMRGPDRLFLCPSFQNDVVTHAPCSFPTVSRLGWRCQTRGFLFFVVVSREDTPPSSSSLASPEAGAAARPNMVRSALRW